MLLQAPQRKHLLGRRLVHGVAPLEGICPEGGAELVGLVAQLLREVATLGEREFPYWEVRGAPRGEEALRHGVVELPGELFGVHGAEAGAGHLAQGGPLDLDLGGNELLERLRLEVVVEVGPRDADLLRGLLEVVLLVREEMPVRGQRLRVLPLLAQSLPRGLLVWLKELGGVREELGPL